MNPGKRVLFICTGNSARSQMAEGLLRHLGGRGYDVFSAGTHPGGLHPRSVEVMRELGVNLKGHTSKGLDTFIGQQFDHVVTVCHRAKEQCPVFPNSRMVNWEFDDPTTAPEESQLDEFRRVRDEIQKQIRSFLSAESG